MCIRDRYSGEPSLMRFSNGLWSATILLVGVDTIFLLWKIKREVKQRFPDESAKGATTFDPADVYADTAAETVLGKALKGERREGLEIFTKVYFPTGPGAHNDHGLSRKHIMESINGSLKRLGTDYVDLYQAHRYDYETPLEETMEAFADVVRQGKAHYIGVSEWTADQIGRAHSLARELRVPFVSNQPQYNMIWRVIETEVCLLYTSRAH